ncbi:MAG TPA: hypothetical protein VMV46_05340 [Thermoanaerobaculia bacterium]|nr:hypothetical protein [Thermoanaerobaculia bacterium]
MQLPATVFQIPAGSTTVPVVVQVNGDMVDESVGTITNDDAQPTVSIGDVSDTEGNAGGKTFSFAVTLSNPSTQQVTVSAATADGSATVDGGVGRG